MPEGGQHFSLDERSADWERLRLILDRIQSSGLQSLSEEQLSALPALYRKTLSDLSLFRTRGDNPMLVEQLSGLCNRAHGVIYGRKLGERRLGLLEYVLEEIPRAVRRCHRLVLASAAVMTVCAFLGWIHCQVDADMARAVLGPEMINQYQTSLRAAHEDADLGLAAQIPKDQRSGMWVMITSNNIRVGFNSFLLGIIGGVPALIMMAFNGYMLGAIAFLYFTTPPGLDVNLPLYFIAGVAAHGAIELPAICLAGAAGMKIGFAWVFPGLRPRGEAMREAVGDAGKLVLATTLTLVVAGIIEAFVTPLTPEEGLPLNVLYTLKIAVGVVVFSLWLAWLYFGGRERQTA
ncbi:stage II sporulation protein M [bacterium]|nr:stage II sporulation protein M [bacterium]